MKNSSFVFLDQENWEELIEVAVGNTEELQIELINILSVQCLDDEAALKWALKFSIPDDKLPLQLRDFQDSSVQQGYIVAYHCYLCIFITNFKLLKNI